MQRYQFQIVNSVFWLGFLMIVICRAAARKNTRKGETEPGKAAGPGPHFANSQFVLVPLPLRWHCQ